MGYGGPQRSEAAGQLDSAQPRTRYFAGRGTTDRNSRSTRSRAWTLRAAIAASAPSAEKVASGKESRSERVYMAARVGRAEGSAARAIASAATLRTAPSGWVNSFLAAVIRVLSRPLTLAD